MKKPYLLAPCGSPEAVYAAVSAGADECYFGGSAGNARMNARGFSDGEFAECLSFLRCHGVRSNITLNILNFDRELPETVDFARKAHALGADAFIVQDLGLARVLSEEIPGVELHASTQCACHSLDGAEELYRLGFSRIVLARELPFEDIKRITEKGTGRFETEVFIHGALCVCHSGMCLMSSVIGKRSGNRGLCAQPCRMQGALRNISGEERDGLYPLSLRDLTLSRHITELLPLGIASLKIEGRMKSPDYVYRTVRVLRELIDNAENADEGMYGELSEIFSRGGFTDGYFTKKYLSDNRKMYGFRSEGDKLRTANAEVEIPTPPKTPIRLSVTVKDGECPTASFYCGDKVGTFSLSEPPKRAQNAPLSRENLLKNMSKLGATPFELSEYGIELDDGLFLAASEINELRRGAIAALTEALTRPNVIDRPSLPERRTGKRRACSSPRLRFITDNPSFTQDKSKYPEPLESICLPLELFRDGRVEVKLPFGVRLPRVIFDGERENVLSALCFAKESGALYTYVSNIGHIAIARQAELPIYGGLGLNVTNSVALSEYAAMGLSCVTLSPELSAAQMRDILRIDGVRTAAVCEGRLPLMVLESCILRAQGLCRNYDGKGSICGEYTDRIGKKFPIYRERRFEGGKYPCRNIILNADTLGLYRNKRELQKCGAEVLEIMVNQ